MNKTITRIVLVIWVLVATVVLAHLVLVHPDFFPKVPESFAIWAIAIYGSTNGEELADLESLLALGAAFIVVLLITLSGHLIWRRIRHSTAGI